MSQQTINNPVPRKPIGLLDILFAPFGCLIQFPPMVLFGLLVVAFFVGSILYNYVNIDLFGIGAPPYEELDISDSYQKVNLPEQYSWKIDYEKRSESKFTGKVRHATPIRINRFLILTHDILVTTGDYADTEKVKTSVSNHKFTWYARSERPKGTINLLHTVPENEEIYKKLISIRTDMQVDIRGREIYRLYAYDADGESLGWWQDSGCNTLLVTYVEIIPEENVK